MNIVTRSPHHLHNLSVGSLKTVMLVITNAHLLRILLANAKLGSAKAVMRGPVQDAVIRVATMVSVLCLGAQRHHHLLHHQCVRTGVLPIWSEVSKFVDVNIASSHLVQAAAHTANFVHVVFRSVETQRDHHHLQNQNAGAEKTVMDLIQGGNQRNAMGSWTLGVIVIMVCAL